MSETDMPFMDLYEGKLTRLLISVMISGTQAESSLPDGVYELTHQEFVRICEALAEHSRETALRINRPDRIMTPHFVAALCDTEGLGDRWFRLGQPVADWIQSKKPLMVVDAFIA